MNVVTERYLVMQRLRVLGNIEDVEFDTAIRLDGNEITIRVVDDVSLNECNVVESYKPSRNKASRIVERYGVTTSISQFIECSQTAYADDVNLSNNSNACDSSETTTRLLFVCLIVGCAFVRSVTTARDLVVWIMRMKRTLRLTNEFVVIVERNWRDE